MEITTHTLVVILYFTINLFSFFSIAEITHEATLPIDIEQYGIPYATFMINGDPIYAQLDTGSSMGFHLKEGQRQKLGELKKFHVYQSTDVAGKKQENIAYLVDSLNMNGLILHNVTVVPYKPWGLLVPGEESRMPPGPVVGLDAFKDKQLLVDYPAKKITVYQNANITAVISNDFTEFPFKLSKTSGLSIEAEHAGHKYHLIIDTGAAVSSIWKERLHNHKPVGCRSVDPEIDDDDCEAIQLTIRSKKGNPMQFAAMALPGNYKHMEDIDGLLGNNFIKHRKLFIDFKHKKLFISDENTEG